MIELSAQEKADINSAMNDIFNIFKRDEPLRFYKPSTDTVVAFDPNYNADFQSNEYFNTNVEHTPTYQEFDARVWYLERSETDNFLSAGQDLGARFSRDIVRIRVQFQEEALAYLDKVEVFEFFNEKYRIEQPLRRVGFLGNFGFYELILYKVE